MHAIKLQGRLVRLGGSKKVLDPSQYVSYLEKYSKMDQSVQLQVLLLVNCWYRLRLAQSTCSLNSY